MISQQERQQAADALFEAGRFSKPIGWAHKAVHDKLTEDGKAQINEIYNQVGLTDRVL